MRAFVIVPTPLDIAHLNRQLGGDFLTPEYAQKITVIPRPNFAAFMLQTAQSSRMLEIHGDGQIKRRVCPPPPQRSYGAIPPSEELRRQRAEDAANPQSLEL